MSITTKVYVVTSALDSDLNLIGVAKTLDLAKKRAQNEANLAKEAQSEPAQSLHWEANLVKDEDESDDYYYWRAEQGYRSYVINEERLIEDERSC